MKATSGQHATPVICYSNAMEDQVYGGVEGGGTKFVCAVGTKAGKIIGQTEIATRTPDETLEEICKFFEQQPSVISLGVGSFGPVYLDSNSDDYGTIGKTTKLGWENVAIKAVLENRLKVPVEIDTDVNCAALGEKFFGQARQIDNFVYMTVGTGIGGALVAGGELYHGTSHIELGHMYVPHGQFPDSFTGTCPSHGDCLEGIASGVAMEQRWGKRPENIIDPKAWELEASYLGIAIANLAMTLYPKLFILGGGVMKHSGLIDAVQKHVERGVNKYLILPPINSYVVQSSNPSNAVLGAILLAPV